jgi:hypothetical protein
LLVLACVTHLQLLSTLTFVDVDEIPIYLEGATPEETAGRADVDSIGF